MSIVCIGQTAYDITLPIHEPLIENQKYRIVEKIECLGSEILKISLGTACLDIDDNGDEILESVQASGRDIISGLPKTLEVTNRDIMAALQESIDLIIDGIKNTIEQAPPEVAADIAADGMVLSGGGGNIRNLDKLIEKRTGIKAVVAADSFEAVALGTGMSLNDIEKLKIYASGIKRR